MDDLNHSPVPPAASASEQAAPLNASASEAFVNTPTEPLANSGSSASNFGSTNPLEPTLRRGAARRDWIVIAVCVVMLMAMGVWLFRSGPQNQDVARPEPKRITRDQFVEVGGVRRPISDVKRQRDKIAALESKRQKGADYGTFPKIEPDANPQVKSVVEAFRDGKHPERISAMVLPQPFDAAAYKANPIAYLNVVEPGRVWQPAQPGPGVSRIGSVSAKYLEAEQGQPTTLSVKALPDAPVTFTSFDGGAFDNQLTSITVKADEKGVAKATFIGTTGTINDVNILAASPATSGQLRYVVNITLGRKSPLVSATTSPKK